MNRRKFLQLLAYGAVTTSLVGEDLFATTTSDKIYYPLDSLSTKLNLKGKKDLFLDKKYEKSFYSVCKKLKLVQRHVGYGNYNVISFDDVINTARWSSNIGDFTSDELAFMEYIFYYNPEEHGFYGERTCQSITHEINMKDIIKIPGTGHYLFQDRTLKTYEHMKNDIGETIVLTSGVRSVMKQMKLFLDKLDRSDLNLSKTAVSIAPPGFSYHTVGDFDIGKKGWGYDNFTARFALTEEFFEMRKLPYIDMRYTVNNKDGVRYEPWHIKIV